MKTTSVALFPRSLGYLTGSISQALADRLRHNFHTEGLDMPHAQFVLLLDLFEEDGQTQQRLADRVFKDKAAIKRTVDHLIAKGLVKRSEDTRTRNNPIWLSPKARTLEPLLRKVASTTIQSATHGIEASELEQCLAVLRKLHQHLELKPHQLEKKP